MIFKYIDVGGVPILENSEIRITNPIKLNDPFEVLPRLLPATKEHALEKLSDPEFLELLCATWLQNGTINSISEFDEYLISNKEILIEDLVNNLKNHPQITDPAHHRNEVGQLYGITSFSFTAHDILMWSHYAEKHKGFVLGFDDSEFNGYLAKVIYSSERVEYTSMLHSRTRDYLFFKILRTKSLQWSYEKEIRAILPWKVCYKKDDGFHYYRFQPENLKTIVLGSECVIKDKLLRIVKEKYPHIHVYTTRPHEVLYELDLIELSEEGRPVI